MPFEFQVFILGVAVVIGALWWLSPDQRARRAMKAVPQKVIRDVADGERVRIVGEVEVRETVVAPLSGRSCAYWRVTVLERRGSGKSARWVTIIDEQDGVDFVLRDPTGKALISTELVTATLEKDANSSSGLFSDAPAEIEAFLESRGHTSEGALFNKSMRYREGAVMGGETLCVVGVGRWERDPEEGARAGAGYRDVEQPKRLVLRAPPDGPLLLSDAAKMTARQ